MFLKVDKKNLESNEITFDDPWGNPLKSREIFDEDIFSAHDDWAQQKAIRFAARNQELAEYFIQGQFIGVQALRDTVEVDPDKRGGIPVLKGTRFTVAQLLAELSDTSGPDEIAENFGIDPDLIRNFLNGLSFVTDKPFTK